MLARLTKCHGNKESEMPFELRVLEAVMLTLVGHHSEDVERCLTDKAAISEGMRARMGSGMLTSIWKLKRHVSQVIANGYAGRGGRYSRVFGTRRKGEAGRGKRRRR